LESGISKEESKSEQKKKQIQLKGEDKKMLKDSLKLQTEAEKLLKTHKLLNQLYIQAKAASPEDKLSYFKPDELCQRILAVYSSEEMRDFIGKLDLVLKII